ncbi:MAG TPA: YdcF family protein [Vicinamibacterales bacterium]
MDALIGAIKTVGGPGSLGFLVLGLTVGIAAARVFSRSRLPRIWMALLAVFYVVCSLPFVAQSVAATLPRAEHLGRLPQDCPTDTLIVLGGDNFRGRLREALRITSLCAPPHVLVSDQLWFAKRLVREGIPETRMKVDTMSRTTLEQLRMVKTYARGKPERGVAVLASILQMPRVEALARRLGVEVILLESPLDNEVVSGPVRRIFPSLSALHVTYDAAYEYLALAYYHRQGWID